ncbi:macrolide transport system ATP-binding/permease protein [Pasteurella testudinis DSM 23072]|uniref:Pyoverdine export ATP-binding/permease protein PvdT n=1 Tax=Pasteurella testudinis DSM 23072 TaxID=1122938 RepID=A0A1W1UYM8_9PAST|nr:MacB family efflux pump subunit [Pasteurella testudinis]SMB86198.1 macrolide transport system ATP-binding/permease protein [Pasteurella testudinis DSM 23072]SUB51746.1 antimicrobial peptide ABC transporter permease [Pasteurella testudinis]
MNIIEVHALNKYFGAGENRVHILKEINLQIKKGDFIAIMGASGSGKSTLMNILGCLDTASDGSYKIDSTETSPLSRDQLSDLRQKKFGFIFQRYNLLSALSAVENVALPAVYAGLPHEQRLQKAKTLLEKLNLGDKLNNKPNQLSGGQQQRVSIARALMNGGDIILADEPTGALDSKSGLMVMQILQDLHREGHTIILVTHDKDVANYANRIIEIKDGQIIQDTRRADDIVDKPASVALKKNRFSQLKDQLLESFKMSVNAILAHKMRSLLTMLGIIIGITSVVCVVAIGNGSQQKILSNINSLGTNTMDIYNGTGFGDRRANRSKNLTIQDSEVLARQNYIESATPNSAVSGTLTYGSRAVTAQARGVGDQFFNVKGLSLKQGNVFTADDVKNNSQVAVIDENTQKELFPDSSPLGQIIMIDKKPLKIIGVAATNNNMGMASSNLNVWLPYTTAMNKISGEKTIDSITVKVNNNVNTQIAEKNLTQLLTMRHGKKDFFVLNTDTIKQTIESTTNTMTLLISSIALISLIVGGIGVMNIMLVSVTERTKEIGVRMAVGARQSNILQQFLIEATLICVIGGLVGIILSYFIGLLFNYFMTDFTMLFSIGSIVAAVICSTLIGLIFGFLPAKNASQLNPITALSRE